MRPTVLAIFAALDKAGEAGMQAGEIAALFDLPADHAARNRLVNNHLGYARGNGFVQRSEERERSSLYHHTPVYRWFITPAGRKWAAAGGYKGILVQQRAARAALAADQEAVAARKAQRMLEAPGIAAQLPPDCRVARDAFIKEMRAAGLELEFIGKLVGVTRERVRQIANGVKVHKRAPNPCQCPACQRKRLQAALDDPAWPGGFNPGGSLGKLYRDWERISEYEDMGLKLPGGAP